MLDCHAHLGGMSSIDFLVEVGEMGFCEKKDRKEIEKLVVCQPDDPKDFKVFLSKFKFLDKIKWTKGLVDLKIKHALKSLNESDVEGIAIDFSVSKYRHIKWKLEEAVEFMLDSFQKHSREDLEILPILSIKYESSAEIQNRISDIIDDPISNKICGIDFVGDTSKVDISIQSPIIKKWREAGKIARMHVGETDNCENIKLAIEAGVTNVAHGIKIVEDPSIVGLARKNDIFFDIAPIGNYITGAVEEGKTHPAKKMIDMGLKLTVGTDDPVTFSSTLSDEYKFLEENGVTKRDLSQIKENGKDLFDTFKIGF